jgi:hypothetical protein
MDKMDVDSNSQSDEEYEYMYSDDDDYSGADANDDSGDDGNDDDNSDSNDEDGNDGMDTASLEMEDANHGDKNDSAKKPRRISRGRTSSIGDVTMRESGKFLDPGHGMQYGMICLDGVEDGVDLCALSGFDLIWDVT